MNTNSLIIKFILLCVNAFFFSVEAKTIVITEPIDSVGYHDRADIREVTITESAGITEIPDYTFLGCTNLKRVHLPSTIRKIGFQAFSECPELEEVNFPEGLEDIGSNSFTYCSRLKTPEFPSTLTHIGHNAFSFCDSIEEVSLPDSIRELESYAFSDCGSLRTARLPANGNLLGEQIFNCCPELESIVMPSPVMPEIDCVSFLFDPLDDRMLDKCRLYVPANLIDSYRQSPSYSIIRYILPMK